MGYIGAMEEQINHQEEFDRYIRNLSPKEKCVFMKGMAIDLCTEERFDCPYRGNETYSLKLGKRKECKRPRIMELKRILGTKN